MAGIFFQKLIILACELLNLIWQSMKTIPKSHCSLVHYN